MKEYLIQITSGRGPEECARVVAKVLELFLKEARSGGFLAEVTETVKGPLQGTLLSAIVNVKGNNMDKFLDSWRGTILWVAQSPYRKYHKRKNWFVGLEIFDITKELKWNEKEVIFETLRASGPGGQHVNKTESAVRAKHLPSGISVIASERRSQFQNKTEAINRLKEKIAFWNIQQNTGKLQDRWDQHNCLSRGNPVRNFSGRL